MNPVVRGDFNSASVIFVSTTDTQNLFSGALRNKTVVFTQLGLPDLPSTGPRLPSGTSRILYAGRLLYWKGVHIAIRAFAEVVKQIPGARFTIVGDGPDSKRRQTDDLSGHVEFVPRVPQQALFELFGSHDLFRFPSLHDSGGFVVLEALSHGLPVVCLDLGGPKDVVTPDSGIVIKSNGNTAQVAATMGQRNISYLYLHRGS